MSYPSSLAFTIIIHDNIKNSIREVHNLHNQYNQWFIILWYWCRGMWTLRRRVHIPRQQYLINWTRCQREHSEDMDSYQEIIDHKEIWSFWYNKRRFLPSVVVSVQLYGCTKWTLTKRMDKMLNGNYKRMLRIVLVWFRFLCLMVNQSLWVI